MSKEYEWLSSMDFLRFMCIEVFSEHALNLEARFI
jgi:hypothetical protein